MIAEIPWWVWWFIIPELVGVALVMLFVTIGAIFGKRQ